MNRYAIGLWLSFSLLSLGPANAESLSEFDWKQKPVNIDGLSLDDDPAKALKVYGYPTSVRFLGSKDPGNDVIVWEYPEKKVAIFKGSIVGIAGSSVRGDGDVLAERGGRTAASLTEAGFAFEGGQATRDIKYNSRWEAGDHLRPGKISLALDSDRVGRITAFNPVWLDAKFQLARPSERERLPKLNEDLKRSVNVEFTTSKGPFEIKIYPDANPEAAARFLSLVRSGYYNDTPFYSVWRGLRSSFGINWRAPFKAEETAGSFVEDTVTKYSLEPGTVAFSGHTGVTINVQDLSDQKILWPKVIGKVTRGLPLLEGLENFGAFDPNQVADTNRLWTEGSSYLDKLGDGKQPVLIVSAKVAE